MRTSSRNGADAVLTAADLRWGYCEVKTIGLLPNVIATAISFFGLHAYGRVPTMLNFSTGIRNLVSGCGSATVKTIYSSRKFIQQAKFEDVVAAALQG